MPDDESNDDSHHKVVTLAVVEGGGTTFRVAVCQLVENGRKSKRTVVAREVIDTNHDRPQHTLEECAAFLAKHQPNAGYDALGVAVFGPVGLNRDSNDYGRILETCPKAAWRKMDVVTPLREACQGPNGRDMPVWLETDVNAPAWAEYRAATIEASHSISSLAYVTVGTGVGVGLVVNGACVHGLLHPEAGQIHVQPLPHDPFQGYSWGQQCSPFGGKHTVEGLASSVALTERLEQQLEPNATTRLERSVLATLPDDHEVWDHAANALANLCTTLLLTVSVERIVLSGGVMRRPCLLPQICARTLQLLNGYLPQVNSKTVETIIAGSRYGDNAGLEGAMVLAERAWQEQADDSKSQTALEEEKRIKQEAFGIGMVHGIMVGAVGAALLLKWMSGGGSRHRRSFWR